MSATPTGCEAAAPQGRRQRTRCGQPGRPRIPGGCSPSHAQALDDAAVLQVFLDDLVDVSAVDIRVPDRVRINDDARTLLAAVEAAGLVDAELARPGEAEFLHAALSVIAQL